MQGLFAKFFPGKSFEEVTADDFMAMAKQAQASEPDLDHWTIGQYVLSLDFMGSADNACQVAASVGRQLQERRSREADHGRVSGLAFIILAILTNEE